jgi:hypothetical protein
VVDEDIDRKEGIKNTEEMPDMSGEVTLTFFYVLRLRPEGNIWCGTTRVAEAGEWEIIMIMQTETDYLSDWLYDLPDKRQIWLEQTTPWEYDMLAAVDIPVFTNYSDLAFARNGWTPTGWEGTTEG